MVDKSKEKMITKLPLAANIKSKRHALGLSLEALSQKCGVSRAMLSDIEREEKNPTILIVCQIAQGLNCTVSELIGEEKAKVAAFEVSRSDDLPLLVDPVSGVQRRLLSLAMLNRNLEVLKYSIPAGQVAGQFPAHQKGVVEHLTIIEGRLNCRLDEQEVKLNTGDSLFFSADQLHEFFNPGPDICHYFLLIDSTKLG